MADIFKHTLTLLLLHSTANNLIKTIIGKNDFTFVRSMIITYRMTTSYLLMMLPRELFLMAKPLPMTTQVLHSRLWRKTTRVHIIN